MTTYKEAGVDVEAGEETVDRIRSSVQETFTPGVLADIGAFGSFFEPDLEGMDEPVLVSSIDGVGTKLKVASRAERYDTVGQDLVNHCATDVAVCGARPLYFLDYYGVGTLEPDTAEAVVEGFARPPATTTTVRWSGARLQKCRTCTGRAISTWWARLSGSWTRARS